MFKNILLPIDLGEEPQSGSAVAVATELCGKFGARLNILAVVPGFGMSIVSQYFPEDFEDKAKSAAAQQVADFIKDSISSSIETTAVVATGTIYEEILQVAQDSGCDLIVMSAHRPDLSDYLLGPNASRVVRHGRCSVLVVRD